MKQKITIAFAALLLFASCTKENIAGKNTSPQPQATEDQKNVTAKHAIGDTYHGGVIFYIDNTGKHGLIASLADQGTGIAWKNNKGGLVGGTGIKVGDGAANTTAIVAAYGNNGNYAALLCANYSSGTFKDWYLPSRDEVVTMFQHTDIIPGLSATNYWSSSETTKLKAWNVGPGFQENDRKTFTLNVRAISSF